MCIYIYPIFFVQFYVMGRFGHENGLFWMLTGAVMVLFFLPLGPFWSGPFWFQWAVFDLHWGRFGDGPFWSVPLQKTNSLHLAKLMERLLDFDHEMICFISSSTGTSLFSGTKQLFNLLLLEFNRQLSSGVDIQGAQGAYASPVRKMHNIFAHDFLVIYT